MVHGFAGHRWADYPQAQGNFCAPSNILSPLRWMFRFDAIALQFRRADWAFDGEASIMAD